MLKSAHGRRSACAGRLGVLLVASLGLCALVTKEAHAVPNARAVRIEANLPWEGLLKPGVATEVRLEVAASSDVLLRLTGSALLTRMHQLSFDQPGVRELTLAMEGPITPPLRLEVLDGDEVLASVDVAVRSLPAGARVVAVVGDWPGDGLVEPGWMFPAVRNLPEHAESYRAVDLLALDSSALTGLSPAQLNALQGYLAGCGRLVLKAGADLAERFRANAGCSGRYVMQAERATLLEAVAGLLERPPASAPGSWSPPAGLEPNRAELMIALLLAGYLLAMVVLALTGAKFVTLALLPLAAAGLGVSMIVSSAHQARWSYWVETEAGDPAARYVALLGVTGARRAAAEVELPTALGVPRPQAGPAAAMAILQTADSSAPRLEFQTGLLRQHRFAFNGSVALITPLALEFEVDGPRVSNRSGATTQPATLAWEGRKYQVPGLAPGATWSPGDADVGWSASAEDRRLRARSIRDRAALLIRHADAGDLLGLAPGPGFTLVRGS